MFRLEGTNVSTHAIVQAMVTGRNLMSAIRCVK
nr:MAG TPA: hypothetical protein [Caudoviricetes sp.]